MTVNWRAWMYSALVNSPMVVAAAPGGIHGGGSLTAVPSSKPFVVLRVGGVARVPGMPVWGTQAVVWAHDAPGSYTRIDRLLADVRGQLSSFGLLVNTWSPLWQGDSGDLADDDWDTIARNSSYLMKEKVT